MHCALLLDDNLRKEYTIQKNALDNQSSRKTKISCWMIVFAAIILGWYGWSNDQYALGTLGPALLFIFGFCLAATGFSVEKVKKASLAQALQKYSQIHNKPFDRIAELKQFQSEIQSPDGQMDSYLLTQRGLEYEKRGEKLKAFLCYLIGFQSDNQNLIAASHLTEYRIILNQFQEADAMIRYLLSREPTNSEFWTMLGEILLTQKNLQKDAVEAFNNAVKFDPSNKKAIANLHVLGRPIPTNSTFTTVKSQNSAQITYQNPIAQQGSSNPNQNTSMPNQPNNSPITNLPLSNINSNLNPNECIQCKSPVDPGKKADHCFYCHRPICSKCRNGIYCPEHDALITDSEKDGLEGILETNYFRIKMNDMVCGVILFGFGTVMTIINFAVVSPIVPVIMGVGFLYCLIKAINIRQEKKAAELLLILQTTQQLQNRIGP